MDINQFVEGLRRDLGHAAEAGGEEIRQAAERLAMALDPAVRLTLMDALSQAASEITNELEGTSVEVRLKGREPIFVVRRSGRPSAAAGPAAAPSRRAPPEPDEFDDDDDRRPDHAAAPRVAQGTCRGDGRQARSVAQHLAGQRRPRRHLGQHRHLVDPDGPRRPGPQPFIQQAHPGVGAMTTEATMHTFETPKPVRLRVELSAGRDRGHRRPRPTTTTRRADRHSGGEAAQELIDDDQGRAARRRDRRPGAPDQGRACSAPGSRSRHGSTVPIDSSAPSSQAGSADIETERPARRRQGRDAAPATSRSSTVATSTSRPAPATSASTRVDGKLQHASAARPTSRSARSAATPTCSAAPATWCIGAVGGHAQGQVRLGRRRRPATAGDGVDAMAGSGDVLVRRVDHGDVKAKTGSGDVTVGVVEGTATYLDVIDRHRRRHVRPRRRRAPPEQGAPTAEVQIQSGSGDVVLQRA